MCRRTYNHTTARLPFADVLNHQVSSRRGPVQNSHTPTSQLEAAHAKTAKAGKAALITARSAEQAGPTVSTAVQLSTAQHSRSAVPGEHSAVNLAAASPTAAAAAVLSVRPVNAPSQNGEPSSVEMATPASDSPSAQLSPPPLSETTSGPGTSAAGAAPRETAATAGASAMESSNSRQAGSSLGRAEVPLTKALVQSSGTGCEDVLEVSDEWRPFRRVRQQDSWVSRSVRRQMESSCTLQLLHKSQHGVSIKVSL